MNVPTATRPGRRGAVSASTVFAIALAIVAGLIFAWLFKVVIFDRRQVKQPVDPTVSVTVTSANIFNNTQLKPINLKTVKVSPETLQRMRNDRGGQMPLTAAQATNRVAKKPILAEMPIFNDDLEEFTYPPSIQTLLEPGKRPAIVEVGARDAMVQLNDHVDLYVTMTNDSFGAGANATALMTKAAKVIARFNTTRPGAQPASPTAPRSYTLQVTPYRYALIELAKTMGAKFSLAVTTVPSEEEKTQLASRESGDPAQEVVTPADLANLFGLRPAGPPPPPPFSVERYDGLRLTGARAYPGYTTSRTAPTTPAATPIPSLSTPTPGVKPATDRQSNAAPSTVPTRQVSFNPSTAVVAHGNFGFRPLGDASCPKPGGG